MTGLSRHESGSFAASSLIDGVERIASFRRVRDYPLGAPA
jgi:hypothetical protein